MTRPPTGPAAEPGDARENGADHGVLAATPMASGLYTGLGFAEVMAIVGFKSGAPAAG